MFNLARYNLQRFNLPSANESDIPYKETMSEAFGALVGTGENVSITEILSEQFRQATYLDPGEHAMGIAEENISERITVLADVIFFSTLAEIFSGSNYVGKDSYAAFAFSDDIRNYTHLGGDHYNVFSMVDSIIGEFSLGGDSYMSPISMYEIFDGEVTSTQFNTYIINLDVTIPPGSTLIVDSNNFVVLLDGENIIHLHSGDWLQLCRDTYDVQIQMGQLVPFDVTMIYQERYL